MTYLLLIPYIAIAFLVAAYLVHRCKTMRKKVIVSILSIFIAFLPIGWDVILGQAYFHYLCSEHGGFRIYQTVKLGREYFDENGNPTFFDDNKTFSKMNIANRYVGAGKYERNYLKRLNIARQTYKIIDSKKGNVLGEYVTYMYFGGWFVNHTGFSGVANQCYPIRVLDKRIRQLPVKVFYQN